VETGISDPDKDTTRHMATSTPLFAESLHVTLSALHTQTTIQYCTNFIEASLTHEGRDAFDGLVNRPGPMAQQQKKLCERFTLPLRVKAEALRNVQIKLNNSTLLTMSNYFFG
jgi:hypothetical protein